MIILVYGKGWIGKQITKLLSMSTNTVFTPNTRVNNTNEVEKDILRYKPDRIVCLIGRTTGYGFQTIDYLEQSDKLSENIQDNLFSTISLALLTQKYKIHLTSLGTGCIFNYDNEHKENSNIGFNETDVPNFFGSSYSTVKGYTDRLLHQFNNVLNIRIRMPITNIDEPGKNFISKIIRYEKIISIPNSMTVLPELLPYLVELIDKSHTGTINFTNPGVITHNQILDMYREIVDPTFTYKNFNLDQLHDITLCKRSNNYLNTTKLEKLFPNIQPIELAIKNTLLNWKK